MLSPVRLCITKVGSSIEITFRLSWLRSVDNCIRVNTADGKHKVDASSGAEVQHPGARGACVLRILYVSFTCLSTATMLPSDNVRKYSQPLFFVVILDLITTVRSSVIGKATLYSFNSKIFVSSN